jgi:hypothetical protein
MATGRKTVVVGQVIDPTTWGNPLWDQSVQTFTSAADRTAQFPAPKQGAVSWLEDAKSLEVFDGTTWLSVRGPTSATAATASSPGTTLLNPGTWQDMIAIAEFPVQAGGAYIVSAFGATSAGGAKSVAQHGLVVGATNGPTVAYDLALTTVTPVAASAIFIAPTTATVKVAWRGVIAPPATGLVVSAGSSVSIGRLA